MGIGHVMRCLTLADALKTAGAECIFVSRQDDGNTISLTQARGFEQILLPAANRTRELEPNDPPHAAWLNVDWETDAKQMLAALSDRGILDWLVVDHYALDARWLGLMRQCAERLFVIDDVADRRLDCDLLLNQNLELSADDQYVNLVPARCRMLLGPQYALLRPAFAELREASRPARKGLSIFVFLGGGDLDGVTILALDAIKTIREPSMTADVIVGSANPNGPAIRRWAKDCSWLGVHEGNAEIATLMAGADIAIGAAGTTTWERACLGVPSVMVVLAENQRRIAQAVEGIGAAVLAGDWENVRTDMIVRRLTPLVRSASARSAMRDAAMRLTDGKGSARVVKEMLA